MKLKLMLLFSLYGLYACAQEETVYEKKVRFGLKAGVNASLFTRKVAPFDGDRPAKYANFVSYYRPSGMGGVTAQLTLNKHFSLGAEVILNSRGMALREPNQGVIVVDDEGNEEFAFNYFNYNIDYIEFPLMINYGFRAPAYKVLVTAYTGLAPGTVINRKTKLRYEKSTDGTPNRRRDEKTNLNSVNPFNTSLLAGLQIGETNTERATMFGDLRFSHTLLPVFEREKTLEGGNLKTYMFTASLAFGVRF